MMASSIKVFQYISFKQSKMLDWKTMTNRLMQQLLLLPVRTMLPHKAASLLYVPILRELSSNIDNRLFYVFGE